MLALASSAAAVVALACLGCGGKAPAAAPTSNTSAAEPAATGATPWPWEAKLQQGASFTMVDEDGNTTTMTVAAVEVTATARTYTLAWTNNSMGPERLVVTGTKVQVGDSTMDDYRDDADAAPGPDGRVCFAEDFANPDGCDDVCDAQICFSADAGLAEVSLLYAPDYMTFSPQ